MDKKQAKLQDQIAVALAEEKADAVKKLRADLGEHLATGANPCVRCGQLPVGMVKTPSYIDRDGTEVPTKYEVGCIFCSPEYIEKEGGEEAELDGKRTTVARRSYSARAFSVEGAVKNWNEGKFIEDNRFGVNVSPEQEARLKRNG